MIVLSSVPAMADAQAKYDHWGIIERSINELNGLSSAGSATVPQLNKLVDNLMARGQVYFDLYEMQRVLVRDHARMLDSADKAGSSTYAAASYFLARAQHELGDVSGASATYRRAAASGPLALRPLATDWLAATTSGGSKWQHSLAAWRVGEPATRATCAPASTQCALFQAILAEDVVAIAKLQRDINRQGTPDFVETLNGKSGAVSIEFFDPLTMYLLGAADYTMVARLLNGRKESPSWPALRGMALLRIGKYKDAEAALKPFTASGGAVAAALSPLVGEAMYRQKNRNGAEQTWRTTNGEGLNILSDVKSALGLDSAGVLRHYTIERGKGLDRFIGGRENGLYLARALLRVNLLKEAREVLEEVRPATRGTSTNSVQPDELALLAHAEYRLGRLPNLRELYKAAREDLQGIAELSPLIAKMLNQLQQVTLLMEGDPTKRGH